MPQGRLVVSEVTQVGEPSMPPKYCGQFKTACGVVARDNVPITYRTWTGPQGDVTVVPDSLKATLWTKILDVFQFPPGTEELVRKRALTIMGTCWKNWKTLLNKEYVKRDQTPNFDEHPKLQDFWDEFVEYKKSEEAMAMSEKNTANSQKNIYPHVLGTGGYSKKIHSWEQREEELI